MKNLRLKILLSLTVVLLSSNFLSNSSASEGAVTWNSLQLLQVNEASRVSHAKELLGLEYKNSMAKNIVGKNRLHESIKRKVHASLAPKYKMQAQTIAETVVQESAKYQLDPVFVLAVIKTESKFNPVARGRHGEIGLMQIKPSTAEWMAQKYDIPWEGPKTLENPRWNIKLGLAYMNYLRSKFDRKADRYVSAYNMGPGNLRKLIAQKKTPEEYNDRVMENYSRIYRTLSEYENENFAIVATN